MSDEFSLGAGWRLCRYAEECSLADLPDDIKECCEVLRETGLWKEYDWFPDHRDSELAFNAATWQLLDYLGVL